jgi:hypothetical protein
LFWLLPDLCSELCNFLHFLCPIIIIDQTAVTVSTLVRTCMSASSMHRPRLELNYCITPTSSSGATYLCCSFTPLPSLGKPSDASPWKSGFVQKVLFSLMCCIDVLKNPSSLTARWHHNRSAALVPHRSNPSFCPFMMHDLMITRLLPASAHAAAPIICTSQNTSGRARD